MPKLRDLTGQRFGRLKVLRRTPAVPGQDPRWECVCDCGKTCIVGGKNLKTGHSRSCGCLSVEITSRRNRERADPILTLDTKRCPKCKQTLLVREFHRNRGHASGIATLCRDCCRAVYGAGRPKDLPKKAKNPEGRRTKQISRLSRFRGTEGFNSESRTYLVEILPYDPCCYCGVPFEHIDHIDPGGNNNWTNLTAACGRCNMGKHKRPLLHHLLAVRLRGERAVIEAQLKLVGVPND